MTRVLVTGCNGFVGRRVCYSLHEAGYVVRGAVRQLPIVDDRSEIRALPVIDSPVSVGNIDGRTDWSAALEGVEIVVHLAARVHVMQEISKNPLESFRSVNVHGTERLARMARERGVRRFVYISSISVHGNSTNDSGYVENDSAHPHSPYAVSKWEGELVLRKVAEKGDIELVIVRPPLVYGAGVGGNFLRLMQWTHKGIPLPLGSIRNKRSFLGVENLADLIVCCVSNPRASGETFVAADGEDLSTPDLVSRIARIMRRPARLIPLSVGFIRALGHLARKEDVLDRLCNSLRVNATKARRLLDWKPGLSLDVGLERTVRWFMEHYRLGENNVH